MKEAKAGTGNNLGFSDPPGTTWLGLSPTFIEIVVASSIATLGVAAMYEGAAHAGDSRGVVVALAGATMITPVVVFIGIWRDVRAKDAGHRLEVRLERLIDLQMQQLARMEAEASSTAEGPRTEPRPQSLTRSIGTGLDE
jgi:hypothetical protein